jgi:hypothetical protein
MAKPCYYHPQSESTGQCINCGMPICAECTEAANVASACARCAPTVRSRMAAQPAAPAPQGNSFMQGSPANAYAPTANTPSAYGQAPIGPDLSSAAVAKANKDERVSLLRGLAVGSVVGIIGCILVLKLLFYSHFGISFLYIAVGYGIGFCICKATGRGGPGLAAAATGIMIVSLLIAHFVYAADFLNLIRATIADDPDTDIDPNVTVVQIFPLAMSTFRPMHWICLAIGIVACWRGVEQQEG